MLLAQDTIDRVLYFTMISAMTTTSATEQRAALKVEYRVRKAGPGHYVCEVRVNGALQTTVRADSQQNALKHARALHAGLEA